MLDRLRKTEPLDAALALALALSLAVTLPAYALDDRVFQGANVWGKTIKFQFALTVYFFTLAFFARFIPQQVLNRKVFRFYAVLVCLAVIGEMIWIGVASANAMASHFNYDNAFMTTVYGLMGVFAVLLTSKSLVYGWLIWKNRSTGLDPALHFSIAAGLVLTFVLTLVAAGALASNPGHYIGAPVTGASIPVLGWSQEVGDLRVSHFFATHALHFLPLIGLSALVLPRPRLRLVAVILAAVAYTTLVLFTLVQAFQGQPFLTAFMAS